MEEEINALLLEVQDLKNELRDLQWGNTLKEIEPSVTAQHEQLDKLLDVISEKKNSASYKSIELFKRQQKQLETQVSHYNQVIQKLPPSLREEVEGKRELSLQRLKKVLSSAEVEFQKVYDEKQKEYDGASVQISNMWKEINDGKNQYETVSDNIKELQNTLQTLATVIKKESMFRLDAPVTVNIYDYMPFIGPLPATSEELQDTLYDNWPDFIWKDTSVPEQDPCKKKKHALNIAQNISMHYFNPFTELKGVLLNHSAGAGKSATASLIASTFVRDDTNRVIVWVTKPGLDHIGVDGITTQADVNVQQYTNGEPLEIKVHSDLVKVFTDNKPSLTKEEASCIASECMILLSSYASPQRKDSSVGTVGVMGCLDSCKNLSESKIAELCKKDYSKDKKVVLKGASAYVQHVVFVKLGIQWKTVQYNEFANLGGTSCVSYDSKSFKKNQTWIDYFRKSVTPKRGEDILENTLIVVDEAHLLVSSDKSETTITQSQCFIQRFLNIAYKSELLSGSRCCKWLLLTATPIIDHPLDLVNLSLLLNTKSLAEEYGFHKYTDVGPIQQGEKTTTNKPKTAENFTKAYKSPDGNKFTEHAVEGFKKMLHGKFSVFNYAGDFSHFSDPEVVYVPVDLQLLQVNQALTTCMVASGKNIDEETGKIVVEQSKGSFVYDNKTKTLSRDKSVTGARGLTIVNKKPPSECLQYTAISAEKINARDFAKKENNSAPTQQPKPRKTKLPASEPISMTALVKGKYTKLLENQENVNIFSPLMYTVLRQIETDRTMTKQFLQSYYKSLGGKAPPEATRMRFLKQTIHIDLKSRDDVWGTKLLEYLLSLPQFGEYKRINPRITNSDPPKMKVQNYIKEGVCDDYKGMIVLDGDIHKSRFNAYKKEAIDYFNNANNADGKKCLLLINTHRLREGISLYDVYVSHLVGYFTSRSYLIQAAYRGIRNCSNRSIPFMPKEGWKIKVRMYTPTFPNSEITGMSLYAMMDETTQTRQSLLNEMQSLLIENAYDAKLLKVINSHSNDVLERFQLSPNK